MVDSISKTKITTAEASSLVTAAFGADASLASCAECEEGWFNGVYRLELGDGSRCVLKVAPPPGVRVLRYEHDIVTSEVEALRLVRERTDLPVPAVLAWDPSGRLLPSPWFVMEHCPGVLLSEVRPTLDPAGTARIDEQIARALASLHTITAPEFGRPDRTAPHSPSWSETFRGLVADLLADADAVDVELPSSGDEIASLVATRAECLDAVETPTLVHWDLWDLNLFVDPESLVLTGMIDFERVLWADPLMEAQFLGKRADDDFTTAYGTPLLADAAAVERRRLYDLYLSLVMLVECSYRNYPTDDIERLARPGLTAAVAELRSG